MATDPFAGIAGHRSAINHLQAQLDSGRVAHAYLLVGEPSLGKTTLARALAQTLLPEFPLHRHPDYWEDTRSAPLKIDDVRLIPKAQPEHHEQTLQQFLGLKPAIAERRVALLSNVNRVADPIQGVLLKTLEEPLPGRVVILTTPSLSPFVVLPTVASRCRRVPLHSVDPVEIARLLEARGVDPVVAGDLAAVARGRPGWAVRAAETEGVLELHRHWADRLEGVFGGPADLALGLAAELDGAQVAWRQGDRAGDNPVDLALAAWQVHLRRRMLAAATPRQQSAMARLVELSYETVGHLEQNVSTRLTLEVLLLECRKAA